MSERRKSGVFFTDRVGFKVSFLEISQRRHVLASTTGCIELQPSRKQPVKTTRTLFLISYLFLDLKKKVSSGALTCNEHAMYPKILEAQCPGIASRIYGT